MRKFFCVFLSIVILFVFSSCQPKIDEKRIVDISTKTQIIHYGKGVILDGKYVLTVAHIFSNADENTSICTVTDMNGTKYEGKILYLSSSHDLAIIEHKSSFSPLKITNVSALVHMNNGEYLTKTKVLNEVNCAQIGKPSTLLALPPVAKRGDSGSPLFDKNGNLVGMVCSLSNDGKYSYALPPDVIRDFLDKFFQK